MLPVVFVILAAVIGVGGVVIGIGHVIKNVGSDTSLSFRKLKKKYPTEGKSNGIGRFISGVDAAQQYHRTK